MTLAPSQSRCHPATIFLVLGSGLPGSFRRQSRFRRKWDGMVQDGIVQNETGKTPYSKPPGPVPLPSRGDKTGKKPGHFTDKGGQQLDIPGQKTADPTLKCPEMSAFFEIRGHFPPEVKSGRGFFNRRQDANTRHFTPFVLRVLQDFLVDLPWLDRFKTHLTPKTLQSSARPFPPVDTPIPAA